ncbi:MAG: FixG Ig-like domain-containing protein, partial [Pseudomonadota bacterium]
NMENRPREMEIALVGLPDGAVMWTDQIGRDNAASRQVLDVAADETRVVRAYVVVPPASSVESFEFKLTSLDEQGEQDLAETNFMSPENQ